MKVAFVVQHHPARAEIVTRLLERLADPLVVEDPGGDQSNAWRSYRQCLRADVGAATHLVIIQDDATVGDHFVEAAEAAIAARPDTAIAFFVSPQCRRTVIDATMAMKKRDPWAPWHRSDFWPTVCSSYPVAVARQLADWVDATKQDSRGDDAPCGDFFRAHQTIRTAVTVPSLAEHPDDVPSLVGRKYLRGKNPARVAKWLVEGDPRRIRW